MLHALGDDGQFALFQRDAAVAQPDLQPALHHQEEFVLLRVPVPDELALQLGQLHLVVVEITYHFRTPGIMETAECLAEVHLLHAPSSPVAPAPSSGTCPGCRRTRSNQRQTAANRARSKPPSGATWV